MKNHNLTFSGWFPWFPPPVGPLLFLWTRDFGSQHRHLQPVASLSLTSIEILCCEVNQLTKCLTCSTTFVDCEMFSCFQPLCVLGSRIVRLFSLLLRRLAYPTRLQSHPWERKKLTKAIQLTMTNNFQPGIIKYIVLLNRLVKYAINFCD